LEVIQKDLQNFKSIIRNQNEKIIKTFLKDSASNQTSILKELQNLETPEMYIDSSFDDVEKIQTTIKDYRIRMTNLITTLELNLFTSDNELQDDFMRILDEKCYALMKNSVTDKHKIIEFNQFEASEFLKERVKAKSDISQLCQHFQSKVLEDSFHFNNQFLEFKDRWRKMRFQKLQCKGLVLSLTSRYSQFYF
jgi:hypothetical protein